MEFKELQERANKVRELYADFEVQKYGREWTKEEIFQGLVGDIGDLSKAIMAKSGVRAIEEMDEKLSYQLSDCLWSVMILAEKYGIDLEESFIKNMQEIEDRLTG